MRQFKVGQTEAGQRADVFVAAKFPDFSRSALERLFDGQVKIAKRPIKPARRVVAGQTLTIDDKLLKQQPEAINLPVIYEDEDVLVINKPAGILTHSKGAINEEATVASFIAPKLDKIMAGNRAGIVHRLDRATSGVIITAKTPPAHKWLQKQFATRKTKKTYLAVVEGSLEPLEAIIDAPVARNPRKPQTFYVNAAGKPAQTQYKVLKSFEKAGQTFSLVELKPLTGRTHQLRVHLAYLKHPIDGDRLYGREGEHLLLHSQQLELTLPSRNRQVFKAEPPPYLTDFTK